MKTCPKCGVEYKDTTNLCPADGSVLESDNNALVGRVLAGKYRVDELVSEGGMGAVYRGTHILMDKTVALKVLHPALAADNIIVARFSREARAASRITHPHAISVTDFGESEDGIVFLVMEFLHGLTLKDIIKKNGPLPLNRVVEIMRQVCGALEAAHAENVVHRDLKSDNIMLIDVAEGDWVKVLDFGIAKIQGPTGMDAAGLTAPDLIIGTPQYMSPEQCSQSSEIDARSDIYSLGVILYEMLAGHVPFSGESPTTVMLKHLQEAPPDLITERSDLPPEVCQLVTRTLAKDPNNRIQTVRDLRIGLTAAAEYSAPNSLTDEEFRRNERLANRIVVQTNYVDELNEYDADIDDETTVVHPSPAVAIASGSPVSKRSSANSWRAAAIALLGVIVIGGILFAMTRNRPSTVDQKPPLTADPNSQPVKPSGPPTGQAERDIAPSGPLDNLNINSNENSNTSTTNENQNTELPPTDNNNTNTQQNTNSTDSNNPGSSNSNKTGNSAGDGASTKPSPTKVDVGPPPPAASPKTKP